MDNKFTVLFAGRRGVPGGKGEKGDKGDSGRSIMVRGQWASGTIYAPGDAVTGDSTAAQGITSLYVQRDGVPESTSTTEPRLDLGRWAEIGATDLSNVTGAIWRVIQNGHGFTGVGQPVTYSQSANRWILATNKIGEPAAVAVVREIVSPNEVILQGSGDISGLDPSIILPGPASQFTAGRFYYASSAPGFLTETPTVQASNFTSNAMLLATGPSSGVVLQWQATPNVVGRRAVGYDSFFYDATPGQTVFSGPDLNANVLAYATDNQMRVLVDGVDVSSFDGFTASTSVSVTLATPLVGGERVEIRVLADPTSAIAPATAAVVDSIQPLFDGVTRKFPLTVNSGAALALGPSQNVLVWLDGNTQEPGADYLVVAGATTDSDIEFTVPPAAGTRFWALAGVPTTNVLPPIASFTDLFVSDTTQTQTLTVTGDLAVADRIIHSGDTDTAVRFPSDDSVSMETAGVQRFLLSTTALTTTVPVLTSAGTAAAPAHSFSGDPNTGMYNAGADTLSFATGGVERVRIDNAGQVGVGTTAPGARFVVSSSSPTSTLEGLRVQNTESGAQLDVVPTGTTFSEASWMATPDAVVLRSNIATSGGMILQAAATGAPIRFATGTTEQMRVTNAGNVGIRTTTPATTLDVNGDVTITDRIIHSGDTDTAIRFPANDVVTVETGGAERLRVNNSGAQITGALSIPNSDGLDALTITNSNASGVSGCFLIRNTESSAQLQIAATGTTFSAAGWPPIPDAVILRTGFNASGGLAVSPRGIDVALFNDAGLRVNGLLTGTAVTQSATDTTAGRLLKVGDYGLGAPSPQFTSDVDTITVNGFYRLSTGAFSTASPTPGLGAGQYLIHYNWEVTAAHQVLYTLGADRPSSFERTKVSNVWGPWRRVFNAGNILGPVGQSGGVPTGRLFERGSNANGEFVRFADGTQMCWSRDITITTNVSDNAMLSAFWNFPAAFIEAPNVVPAPRVNFTVFSGFGSLTTSQIRQLLGAPTAQNTVSTLNCELMVCFGQLAPVGAQMTGQRAFAVGRWF